MDEHVIGIDFGTDSARSLVMNARSGEELSQAVAGYPRWGEGLYCEPRENRFRQHPLDHIEALETCVREALDGCPPGTARSVRGISADTTGSTPGPVDARGVPLSLHQEFAENPNAMFMLWKDHTAVEEAEAINLAARTWGGPDFTIYSGGSYSSEWFWAKMLHALRVDGAVRDAAFSWVEHCDWIPALLTGNLDVLTFKRSRCAAGHKAMWNASFGGLPPEEFLRGVDPLLSGVRQRLYVDTATSDLPAGLLSPAWADRLGLGTDVVVGVGAIDAHMAAVGGGIEPGTLAKVIGTSTCDMVVAPPAEIADRRILGICGQVDGSIVPGLIGMEAGQSAFGDVYGWFADLLMWPLEDGSIDEADSSRVREGLIDRLMTEAARRPPGSSDTRALDWLNGRRTPEADLTLEAAVAGLSLGTDAVDIFGALVEATCYGAKAIADKYESQGIRIERVLAMGGIPHRAPYVMQVLADVFGKDVEVAASEQTGALGAAMFAATASGIHGDVLSAQKEMGHGFSRRFIPRPEYAGPYRQGYRRYLDLGRAMESAR
ncbi:MAG: ribulokinase [Actinobacteria bacterium]|nr:ribulokinase [Actinomycetota bacterium]MBU2687161.1 ribulokinase [Actinomycetota bacterium]